MNLEIVFLWIRAGFECCGGIETPYMEEILAACVVSCDVCYIGCDWKKWNRGEGVKCGEGIGLETRANEA